MRGSDGGLDGERLEWGASMTMLVEQFELYIVTIVLGRCLPGWVSHTSIAAER